MTGKNDPVSDKKKVKMTMKSLSDELDVLKEQMKGFESLKIEFKELQDEVKLLRSQEENTRIQKNQIECKDCGKCFTSKAVLKKHLVQVHPKVVDCKLCDQSFSYNHELEVHVKCHGVKNEFKCEVCNKEFYLEWRFKKHVTVHSDQTKPCKYNSRKMPCPFDIIGCKFKHESNLTESSMSPETNVEIIEDHDEMNVNYDVDLTFEEANPNDVNIENLEEGRNDEIQDDQIKCPLCEYTFLDQEEVSYHMKADHFQWL